MSQASDRRGTGRTVTYADFDERPPERVETHPVITQDPLDLAPLEAQLPQLAADYAAAEPYPHIVLDDVLHPEALAAVLREFDAISTGSWTNYLHLNERKYANTRPDTWGPTLRTVADAFTSERFVAFLSQLTGIPGLMADDSMDGGGLHRSMAGGFLNVHADFTAHHSKPGWHRRVNLLLYLNPDWQPEWGGELELWSADMSRCVSKVAPIANRVLLFTTDERSYHGHPDVLRFPEGLARQSMALYYFTQDTSLHARATDYRARPGDGGRRALIYIDKKALQVYDVLKRRFRISDGAASRALGWLGGRRKPR